MNSPTLIACRRAAQEAEHHALQLGPDWSGSPPILDECVAFRHGCDALAENRGLNMATIAFVGPKDAGKTTLVSLLIADDKVRAALKIGYDSAHGTEKPTWVSPEPPDDLHRGQEDYIPCHESELEPLGFRYAILDVPGLDEGEAARSGLAIRALDQAQVKVLAIERAKLETANWQTYLAKTDGAAIVPIITHTPPPNDPQDALTDYDLIKFEQALKSHLPTSAILPTIVMGHCAWAGANRSAILDETRKALRERLAHALREKPVETLAEPQLIAKLQRFKREVGNLAVKYLPATKEALGPLEAELLNLPIAAVNDLLGSEKTLAANARASLRSVLLDHTPVFFFPWRLSLSIANLVHGATDRLPLALLGSPLSIITTASTVAKNLWRHHKFNEDIQTGLQHQLEARLKGLFSSRLARLERSLASDLKLGSNTKIHTQEKSSVRLMGLTALQTKSTESFRNIIGEKSFTPREATLLGLLGCLIFWSILGQPLLGLYLDFFHAADEVLTRRAASIHSFPSDTFSMMATSTLLAVLPMTLLLLLAVTWLTRKRNTQACIEKLRAAHQQHITDMRSSGELFTELTEPQLDSCRLLLGFGIWR